MAKTAFILKFLIIGLIFSSCSFLSANKEKKLRILSVPEGAEIRIGDAPEPSGISPFDLGPEQMKVLQSRGYLSLKISKMGYQEQRILLSDLGIAEVKIDLVPLDKELFNRLVLGTYSAQINEILRDMLAIQGLFVLEDIPNCKIKLEAFVSAWPTIGAAYTMLGSIAVREKDYSLAKSFFSKAVFLDPKDSTAEKMLKAIESGEPE